MAGSQKPSSDLVTPTAMRWTITNRTLADTKMPGKSNLIDSSDEAEEDSFSFRELAKESAAIALPSPATSLQCYQAVLGFSNKRITINKDGVLQIMEVDQFSNTSGSTISIHGDTIDQLENVYQNRRDDMVNKKGFIFTPLHILKELATQHKQTTHIEHYVLKHPSSNKKLYRVDILVGKHRGVGQCTRKQLARQLAAIDLLEKLKLADPATEKMRPTNVHPHGLLPGWRVDEMVNWVFKDICKERKLSTPVFTFNAKEHELGKCTITCQVGNVLTEAESDLPWLAKKLAIRKMIQEITYEDYQLEGTSMGNRVLGFPEMKLLGFKPTTSGIKRKWIMDHRVKDTQVVFGEDEPNDGELGDVEQEVQSQSSKRFKAGPDTTSLKITVPNQTEASSSQSSVGASAVSQPSLSITVKNEHAILKGKK